jgi:ribosomal protein L37AE/L43A
MEGWIVLILTLAMATMVVAYLFSGGVKKCPVCKKPMVKDKIGKEGLWACRGCGHVKQKVKIFKRKIKKKRSFYDRFD